MPQNLVNMVQFNYLRIVWGHVGAVDKSLRAHVADLVHETIHRTVSLNISVLLSAPTLSFQL